MDLYGAMAFNFKALCNFGSKYTVARLVGVAITGRG
jgi:hypothetical protein